MDDLPRIVIAGDLMVECMISGLDVPDVNHTHVVDAPERPVGGSAVNLAWHLAHLGHRPRIIGFCGEGDRPTLDSILSGIEVDKSGLVYQKGATDLLISFLSSIGHRSVYLRSGVPEKFADVVAAACKDAHCLVVNGTRHKSVRTAFEHCVKARKPPVMVFSPSYSIYEYDETEFTAMASAADVTILNEQETRFGCEMFAVPDPSELSLKTLRTLICTYGDRGAEIWQSGARLYVPSLSGIRGDVVGAGDAFLSGFIDRQLVGTNVEEAGIYGAVMASFVVEKHDPRPVTSPTAVKDRAQNWDSRDKQAS